mmetsp:Transcript_2392/g.2507  ORF Transcript_2392/g.2507 Transcript_2392/m.2507 type:complete len:482 (+) Transcript_2392:130-1575(+)
MRHYLTHTALTLIGSSLTLSLEFGDIFGIPLQSSNLNLNCNYEGYPICCSALNDPKQYNRDEVSDWTHSIHRKGVCRQQKRYISSPYELNQYRVAVKVGEIDNENERSTELIKFLSSPEELEASIRWLKRVKYYSTNSTHKYEWNHPFHEDDYKYLSYYNVTETCSNHIYNNWWLEWIEPLTIHARHPFSMLRKMGETTINQILTWFESNNRTNSYFSQYTNADMNLLLTPSVLNTDHILLQNGASLTTFKLMKPPISSLTASQSPRDSESDTVKLKAKANSNSKSVYRNKKYLFDAGTSRFDSSLYWFICSYSQVSIEFDHIFGWELTLLEPVSFWRKVPPKYHSSYSFYNLPVTANDTINTIDTIDKYREGLQKTSVSNPLNMMLKVGVKETDFVAFKLDIDFPETEIPLALSLLHYNHFSHLVDEFFFELHFRCEFMMKCCWGKEIPERFLGLSLFRPDVLLFFRKLREKGIRAHFWV